MHLKWKIFFAVLIAIGIGIVSAVDIADRDMIYSRYVPEDELQLFLSSDDIKDVYERSFENPKYKYPRADVANVKIYKNQFLISRLTSKTLSEENVQWIIDFLNDPTNYDWTETTWQLNESDYILRFFDENDNQIGTVWLCLVGCGMTESIPFSPNMKFGGLSSLGKRKLNRFLNQIYR